MLRHQQAANRTAATLANFGYRSTIVPLSKIKLSANPLPPGSFSGVILTSSIAAQTLQNMAAAAKLKNLPIYCVGQYTAESAELAGFTQISAIQHDAHSLAAILEKFQPEQSLLYACARNLSFDFAAHLTRYGIHCLNWEIYANELISPDITQLASALKSTDTVFLYSKRTASHFFNLIKQEKSIVQVPNSHAFITISSQVGQTVPRKFHANTYIAHEKSESGMIGCLSAIAQNE